MSGSRRRSLVDFLSSCVLAAGDLLVLCTLVTSKRVFPGHETSVLTLCNFAPPSRRDDLETMHKAANARHRQLCRRHGRGQRAGRYLAARDVGREPRHFGGAGGGVPCGRIWRSAAPLVFLDGSKISYNILYSYIGALSPLELCPSGNNSERPSLRQPLALLQLKRVPLLPVVLVQLQRHRRVREVPPPHRPLPLPPRPHRPVRH